MTNHWVDIKNADVILVMGGNAAEAHPCGFKWVTEAKAHRKARLIVVDPRFTRTASVADYYAPIRTGTDIVFLGGVINYLLTNDKIQHEYVKNYTDFPFIVREDFAFNDGLYLRLQRGQAQLRQDDRGTTSAATTASPRSIRRCSIRVASINLMKQHYSRYTPEQVEKTCGTPKDKFLKVCEMLASTAVAGARRHDPVCARLDASLGRRADDPHRRDGAVAAGQYRHRGRRHERAARALEHPGPDRPRPDVEPAAGLHDAADGSRAGLRGLHHEARRRSRCGRTS